MLHRRVRHDARAKGAFSLGVARRHDRDERNVTRSEEACRHGRRANP